MAQDDPTLLVSQAIENQGRILQIISDHDGIQYSHEIIDHMAQEIMASYGTKIHHLIDILDQARTTQLLSICKIHFQSHELMMNILMSREISDRDKAFQLLLTIPMQRLKSDLTQIKMRAEEWGYQKVFQTIAMELRSRGTFVNILTWIGNLTWGLPNTLVGLGVVVVLSTTKDVLMLLRGNRSYQQAAFSQNGKQIYVNVSGIPGQFGLLGWAAQKISLGIWEIDLERNSYFFASGHEGGHAIQSAILGPFYLPYILTIYAMDGPDNNFAESWADYLSRY